jgi:hypothetical protein
MGGVAKIKITFASTKICYILEFQLGQIKFCAKSFDKCYANQC